MNSKKNLITIVIIIVVLIVGGLLWRGGVFGNKVGEVSNSPINETSTTGMGEEKTTTEQTGNVEKINDDIYVELMAQTAYLSQKSPSTYVSEMQKLYSKYGLTQESFTAFGDELGKDPVRTQEIVQKYTKRLQELMK